jgi:hypothetical protein
VISHLEILCQEKRGSSHLAEVELQEELATDILFYDVRKLFSESLWSSWLNLARRYKEAFCAWLP